MTAIVLTEIPPTIIRAEGSTIVWGVAKMYIPSGGAHVRGMMIYFPEQFAGPFAVTATVHAISGPETAGVAFGIYSIKANDLGDQTQVAIEAANVSNKGQAVTGDWLCHYVIIGKSAK